MSSEDLPENVTEERLGDTPLILLSNRYRVLNVLGDGGFGKTFLVEDTHMPSNRRCVLKQLKPVHEKPEIAQMVKDRFEREAATLEHLGEAHDQIPRLYAYFQEGGEFYLVEEWVEGVTLTQKVQREGPQSEKTVQAVVANLLGAIAYIHSQKMVHRDIKPDNIILRARDGKPVLIDFGAVKETMKTVINSGEQSTHSIVVGTPGYMPSEQMSGRPIYASDIYSLGMSAIYMLTGKIPQELMTNPQTGSLDWREYAPTVSNGFANFLDCATHVSPQSRFATVQDMQSVLNTLMMSQMGTEMSAPTAGQTTSASHSTQTVVSSAPFVPTPATTHPTISDTIAVSPLGSNTTGQPGSMPYPSGSYPSAPYQSAPYPVTNQMPSQGSSQSSSQWKGAVIVGGMVGFSILIGALVVTQQIPGFSNREDDTADTVVEAIDETSTPDETSDETSTPDEPPAPTPAPVAPPTAAPTPAPPAAAPNANGSVVGQTGSKNVRAGAGTNFAVVDTVQVGDRIRVVNRTNDAGGFPWYQILTPSGAQGWIAGQLIQIDGDAAPPSTPTPQPPPSPTPTPVDRTNATIVSTEAGSKNIRSGPGTNYSVRHIAYPGDRIIIQTSSTDSGGYTWYKVTFPKSGAEGWIAAQLVQRD
ncbi:Bacterial SH3 domain family [Synechococcus sp. PCC 7335]|uniref:serine/threonine protein kinase n=1 Tax=Synechococcus sp. (strain ATCC 29403 / PCC 7335) TaxID=91464 RepID=UPI00017ED230|nr:serine/threonine protein kinase [Synechococcus sp. PCC 7335]EDX83976.1 Bacterial SH3 domain family [Synechococcus sp. PCC 7335]